METPTKIQLSYNKYTDKETTILNPIRVYIRTKAILHCNVVGNIKYM